MFFFLIFFLFLFFLNLLPPPSFLSHKAPQWPHFLISFGNCKPYRILRENFTLLHFHWVLYVFLIIYKFIITFFVWLLFLFSILTLKLIFFLILEYHDFSLFLDNFHKTRHPLELFLNPSRKYENLYYKNHITWVNHHHLRCYCHRFSKEDFLIFESIPL